MKIPPFVSTQNETPTNTDTTFDCPNCWGRQQWDDQYQPAEIVLAKTPSQAASTRDGFIRKFMLKYVLPNGKY